MLCLRSRVVASEATIKFFVIADLGITGYIATDSKRWGMVRRYL